MRPSLEEIALFLCCPDDRASVFPFSAGLRCRRCSRNFSLFSRNVLDFLPSCPFPIPAHSTSAVYQEAYRCEFLRPLAFRENAKAWGVPEDFPARWVSLRRRQSDEVLEFLRDESIEPAIAFCDLSAGAGYCTFAAAKKYRLVFHCDLSADALAYAAAKAERNHIENIFFLRADYFQPPFRNSMPHLACLDTLIRGPWHEMALLTSIRRALSSRGVAVVDFHYWWHNPLRRLGLLPDNFAGNKSYTRRELKKILTASGISEIRTQGFVQEVDSSRGPAKFLSRLVPPTRLMVRLAGENRMPVSKAVDRAQMSRV